MFEIREILTGDTEEITRLSAQLGYPNSVQKISRLIRTIQADLENMVYVAQVGETVLAGFVHIFLTNRLFIDPFAEVGGLIVDERYRGTGLGGDLLTQAENWAVEKGCAEMRVRSNIIREDAHKFYIARGFAIVKKQTVLLKTFTD